MKRKIIDESGPIRLQVDGGVNSSNVLEIAKLVRIPRGRLSNF